MVPPTLRGSSHTNQCNKTIAYTPIDQYNPFLKFSSQVIPGCVKLTITPSQNYWEVLELYGDKGELAESQAVFLLISHFCVLSLFLSVICIYVAVQVCLTVYAHVSIISPFHVCACVGERSILGVIPKDTV